QPRDLRRPPAVIRAAAQGASRDQHMMTSYYRDSIGELPEMRFVAEQLYEQAGVRPSEFQTAVIYDHFTPFVLAQLEAFGFCKRGEAKDFVQDGRIELGGELPINTHGGQLGEAYIHGMNGVAEAGRHRRPAQRAGAGPGLRSGAARSGASAATRFVTGDAPARQVNARCSARDRQPRAQRPARPRVPAPARWAARRLLAGRAW